MRLPPAVIIHSLAHAQRVLSLDRPVTLISAPAAAVYAGCLWWRELIKAAVKDVPNFLDCADAPGRAIEALKLGLPGIILGCEHAPSAAVTEIALRRHAFMLAHAPPALDLARHATERELLNWLNS